MAYTIPLLEDIAATLLRDISNQLPDADVGKDSDFAIRANAIASAVQGLYQHQVWIVRQMFPDTADHDYLVMHARTRNLQPKPATYAGGKVQLTGNAGVAVKSGLQFRPKGGSLLCCWFRSHPIANSDFIRSSIPVARSLIPISSDH